MSAPGGSVAKLGSYEVGVAIMPLDDGRAIGAGDQPQGTAEGIPGYEETRGGNRGRVPGRASALIERGDEAVRAATEAIAGQVGLTAQRLAAAIGEQVLSPSTPGALGVESVEVSFGVTLTAGVQTIFTAQAESSAQVSITLSRQPGETAGTS